MEAIKITLNIDETNLILNALGDQPYKQVFQLVQKIQQQAAQQIDSENVPDISVKNGRKQKAENGQPVS